MLNRKNQVLRKSTPASSHESINANYRQVLLTATYLNVIQFEKKQSINFLLLEKISKRILKNIFQVYSGPCKSKFQIIYAAAYITVFLPDSNNCFSYMQYHISISISTIFSFFFFCISPSFSYFARPETQFSYNI